MCEKLPAYWRGLLEEDPLAGRVKWRITAP
jgi:hypothetical protein